MYVTYQVHRLGPYKPIPPIAVTQTTLTTKEDDCRDFSSSSKSCDVTEEYESRSQTKEDLKTLNSADALFVDVMKVLERSARRLHQVSRKNEFFIEDVGIHVTYILLAHERYKQSPYLIREFGRHLAKLNVVEFFQKLLRHSFEDKDAFDVQNEHSLLYKILQRTLWLMLGVSNISVEFCNRIISTGLHKDFIEYLSSKTFRPDSLESENSIRHFSVQVELGTLYNVVQKVKSALETFRECKAVDILQPFREATKYQLLSCMALIIQSYLVTDEENERINSDSEVFQFLVTLLKCAIDKEDYNSLSFTTIEVIEPLNKLAVNDSNKQRIVDAGALPYYVQLMQSDRAHNEQSEAARGIWMLAFNEKCKELILKEDGCIEALQTLVDRTYNDSVKKNAEGALWILSGNTTNR